MSARGSHTGGGLGCMALAAAVMPACAVSLRQRSVRASPPTLFFCPCPLGPPMAALLYASRGSSKHAAIAPPEQLEPTGGAGQRAAPPKTHEGVGQLVVTQVALGAGGVRTGLSLVLQFWCLYSYGAQRATAAALFSSAFVGFCHRVMISHPIWPAAAAARSPHLGETQPASTALGLVQGAQGASERTPVVGYMRSPCAWAFTTGSAANAHHLSTSPWGPTTVLLLLPPCLALVLPAACRRGWRVAGCSRCTTALYRAHAVGAPPLTWPNQPAAAHGARGETLVGIITPTTNRKWHTTCGAPWTCAQAQAACTSARPPRAPSCAMTTRCCARSFSRCCATTTRTWRPRCGGLLGGRCAGATGAEAPAGVCMCMMPNLEPSGLGMGCALCRVAMWGLAGDACSSAWQL